VGERLKTLSADRLVAHAVTKLVANHLFLTDLGQANQMA